MTDKTEVQSIKDLAPEARERIWAAEDAVKLAYQNYIRTAAAEGLSNETRDRIAEVPLDDMGLVLITYADADKDAEDGPGLLQGSTRMAKRLDMAPDPIGPTNAGDLTVADLSCLRFHNASRDLVDASSDEAIKMAFMAKLFSRSDIDAEASEPLDVIRALMQ